MMVNRLCSENEKRRPGCPQYKEVGRTVGMPWESVRHYYKSRASKKVRQEAIVRKKAISKAVKLAQADLKREIAAAVAERSKVALYKEADILTGRLPGEEDKW